MSRGRWRRSVGPEGGDGAMERCKMSHGCLPSACTWFFYFQRSFPRFKQFPESCFCLWAFNSQKRIKFEGKIWAFVSLHLTSSFCKRSYFFKRLYDIKLCLICSKSYTTTKISSRYYLIKEYLEYCIFCDFSLFRRYIESAPNYSRYV